MKSIIQDAEEDFDYQSFFNYHASFVYHDVPSSFTLAAVKTAYSSNAKRYLPLRIAAPQPANCQAAPLHASDRHDA